MYPNSVNTKYKESRGVGGRPRDVWPWDTEDRLNFEVDAEKTGKSKPSASRRKVIRLDHDKYHDSETKPNSRNPIKSHGIEHAGKAKGTTRKPYQTNGDLDLLIQRENHDDLRKVDFSNRQRLRELNTDGSYLDSVSQIQSQTSLGDLTDSRALRETEIRFLNTNAPPSKHQSSNLKTGGPKLTYVDVPFLGQYTHHAPPGHQGNMELPASLDIGGASAQSDSGDQINGVRRKRRGLTDLPENNDILNKLKEKIRQQQLNASSSDTSSRDESLLEQGALSREPQHVLHDVYDPVSLRPGANCDGMDKPVISRKIATGITNPTYKGFTDITSDRPLIQSTAIVKKKIKKPPPTVNIQPRKYEMYGTEYPSSAESGLSSTEKPKNPTRVVSRERKNTYPANDIITTSSWRVGQELVRQKLGPALRTNKSSGDSQRKDVVQPEEQRRPDGAEGHDLWQHVGSDNTGTLGNDKKKTKTMLSEETQKILDDLHIDQDVSDEESNRNAKSIPSRPAVKRKAPKHSEPDKQPSIAAKQRHYDQEAVRKYIAKQKAERQRRKKEEEEQQLNVNERRKRHLEELKQKTSAPKPKVKSKHKPQPKTRRTASDETHDRKKPSGGSDKDNQDTHNNTVHDLDDDSDTLTGNSDDETTPVSTPREERKRKEEQTVSNVAKPTSVDPKFNINVNEVLLRFSEVVKQRKAQAGLLPEQNYPQPSLQSLDPSLDVEQRKQAIKEMATSLRSRLSANAQSSQPNQTTTSRVNFQAATAAAPVNNQDKKEYSSRYDRLVGNNSDIFSTTTTLPSSRELGKRAREVLEENFQKEAAIRIQSAYRGHSARRSLDLTSPVTNHTNSKLKSTVPQMDTKDEDDSEVTVTSTFSEVTVPEDSENDSLKLFHNRTSAGQDRKYAHDKRQPPVGGACYVPPSKYKWEEPKADPYSVMNILSRKSKFHKDTYSLNPVEQQIRETVTQTILPPDSRSSLRSSSSSHHYTASLPTSINLESNLRPHRLSRGYSDDDASIRSSISKGHSIKSASREPKEKSEELKPRQEGSNRVTLNTDSDVTDSDESYSNFIPDSLRHKSHRSESVQKSAESENSEASLASHKSWSLSERVHPKQPPPISSQENIRTETGRYSPNSLDRQLMAELNRLESLEESYCQLAGVERTRAVSLAQQESVSLAQVLKSRQMTQDLEMKKLRLQAQQEAQASNQQLNDIKLRTQGNIYQSPYSQQPGFTMEPTLHSTPASKTTETVRKRPEVTGSHSVSEVSGRRSDRDRTDTEDVSDSVSTRRNRESSKRTSYTSRHSSKPNRSASSSVVTAKDSQLDSDSGSIKSVSDANAQDLSKAESIQEDIPDGDYTLSFDESITEDESFRQVLPSESHRKEVKRRQSDDSFLQDGAGTSQLSIGDMSSLFVGGDTFSKFTADMVRQLMKEEELRAQHQGAMLRIRETALKKKAETELAWLRQQKQHLRDKGADDVHPHIKKKEKIVMKELQEKQAEIRRLHEANLQTSRERQLVLKQQEAIAKQHQKKRMAKLQDGLLKLTGRLGRPSDIHTEDEASALEDASDINEDISAKDYKSDSEVYAEKVGSKVSKGDKRKLEKKQLWLHDKYLTKREYKLLSRKKNAEELLAWKKSLDNQEAEVYELEKKALVMWNDDNADEKKNDKKVSKEDKSKTTIKPSRAVKPERKESESIISEQISTARDESYTPTSHISTKNDVKSRPRSPKGSGSDVSIPEEFSSKTSLATPDKHKVHDLSDDTIVNSSVNEEYTNDTFDADTSTSRRRKPLGRYLPSGSPLPSPWSRRTGSESESEDSISHTDTVSDTSDYEGRIRHLNDELRRRRKEFDLLKKEKKHRKKERLKAQEESLKKQVEAYDNYINQLKHEQSDLELEPGKLVVKPLIKQQSKTKPSHIKTDETAVKRQRDQEGSFSSSYEDTINGSDSAQTSPNLSDSRDNKLSPLLNKKSLFLDRISEGSESAQSASEKLAGKKSNAKESHSQSSVSELIEELSQVSDGSQKTESGLLKLDIGRDAKTGDEVDQSKIDDDPSYSLDFTASASSLPTSLNHNTSAKSDRSASRLISEKDPFKISEQIDEAISVHSGASRSLGLDLNAKKIDDSESVAQKSVSQAVTGIQESDSENDSHAKSQHTLSYSPTVSRPSSGTERSVASSYGVNFEDEESERTVESESESEKTPVHVAQLVSNSSNKIQNQITEDEISEHISASLPSLSEKKSINVHRDEATNQALDQILGELTEEELTPREGTPLIGEDENTSLLLTDPLAEFQLNEQVLVWGRKKGQLLFKGKVDFAPGIWAGVELEDSEEDQDDMCQRYFTCRQGHGALVPGSDISTVREDMKPSEDTKPDDSMTSQDDASTTTDSELDKVIKNAAQNVQDFGKEEVTDRNITKEIAAESVETIEKVSDKQTTKKIPPPILPKPKKKTAKTESSPNSELAAKAVMNQLLENAISQMIDIRNKKRKNEQSTVNENQTTLVNGHLGSDGEQWDVAGGEAILSKEDFQRPHTPALSGSRIQEVEQLDKDLLDLLGADDDDEYFEETLGMRNQTERTGATKPIKPEIQEIVSAVPHERDEVEEIINDSIDVYWNCRRCGEPFTNATPPASFYKTDETNLSMEQNSEKTYKRLLFELTGEIICDIYSSEEEVVVQAWEKSKRRKQQYFKAYAPPTTVDALRPVILKAVSDILGVNGTRKADRIKNKFNLRKKKDHVDNILAQELREEEPEWLDYNADEVDVKMALTDNIFEMLLNETVDTCTKIHNNKLHRTS